MICPQCGNDLSRGNFVCPCGASVVCDELRIRPVARTFPLWIIPVAVFGLAVLGAGGWLAFRLARKRPPSLALPPYRGEKPSLAQAEEFARRLESDIGAGRHEAFDVAFDQDGMLERVTEGVDVSRRDRDRFARGAREQWDLGRTIGQAVREGGSYRFIRVRQKDGEVIALFRLLLPEGGFNYHELQLGLVRGAVRIEDLYIFLTGETIGTTARRLFIGAAAEMNRPLLARLERREGELVRSLPKLQEIGRFVNQKKGREAMAVIDGLPAEVRREKIVIILRVIAASMLSDEQHLRAIEEAEAALPGDPSLDLISIDGYFLRKKYDAALRCMDRLGRALGGDGWLDYICGNLYMETGLEDMAKRKYLDAVAQDPALEDAWWQIVRLTVGAGRFGETSDALTRMWDRKIDTSAIESDEFRIFTMSSYYARWRALHPKK